MRGGSSRCGFFLPTVFVVLIIFVILGLTMMFSGTSEYQQTAVVIHGMKANQMVMAVLEELQTVVYDRVNHPDPTISVWRPAVLSASKNGTEYSEDLTEDAESLLESRILVEEDLKGKVRKAKVTFHGWRRIKYSSEDRYDVDDVFYNMEGLDVETPKAPDDRYGYYTLRVAVEYGKALRSYTVTHDIKIIDVSPPAREFALFNFQPLGEDQRQYTMKDLNEGGDFRVFANGKGRVFIRGPYVLKTSDHPQGVGGWRPEKKDNTYPLALSWWQWNAAPPFRDGQLQGGLFSSEPPARPKKASDSRIRPDISGILGIVGGAFLGPLGAAVGSALGSMADDAMRGGDPGFLMPDGEQGWFAGAIPWGQQTFSILGDPEGKVGGQLHLFRGLKNKYDENFRLIGSEPFNGEASGFTGGMGSSVEPEGGGLLGEYHVVKFNKETKKYIVVTREKYSTSKQAGRPILAPYGIRFEEKRGSVGGGFSAWLSLGIDAIMAGAMAGAFDAGFGGGEATFSVLGQEAITAGGAEAVAYGLIGTLANQNAAQVFSNQLVATDTIPATGLSAGDLTASFKDGFFPPNFKPYARAATRHYDTLEDAMPADGSPVLLDGVVLVDRLNTDKPLQYIGKGIIASYSSGTDENIEPKIGGPIQRMTEESHLTLAYITGASTDGLIDGDAMLELGNSQNEASIVSSQGVKSSQQIAIQGNLVTQVMNKSKIPAGGGVHVFYDVDRLFPSDTSDREDWLMISVSPKVSGWSDKITLGAGGEVVDGDEDLDPIAGF